MVAGVGSVLMALSAPRAALAEDGAPPVALLACEPVHLYAPDVLPADWSAAVSALRDQLATADTDCAVIALRLEAASQGAKLVAVTREGRYGERVVPVPSVLAATAFGLLASIPPEEPRETPPIVPKPPPAEGATAHPPPQAERDVHAWLALAAGLRAGAGAALPMIDFEGRADAVLGPWLFALSARYGFSVGPDLDDYQYEETVITLGAGRRIAIGRGALDLTVSPEIALMGLQWDQDDPDPRSGTASAFRVGVAARWSSPLAGVWRFTMTADADAAPTEVGHPIELGPGVVALPTWTVGVRLGACTEVL
jgi:hypothetical protein